MSVCLAPKTTGMKAGVAAHVSQLAVVYNKRLEVAPALFPPRAPHRQQAAANSDTPFLRCQLAHPPPPLPPPPSSPLDVWHTFWTPTAPLAMHYHYVLSPFASDQRLTSVRGIKECTIRVRVSRGHKDYRSKPD